jgi:hypothetical protein
MATKSVSSFVSLAQRIVRLVSFEHLQWRHHGLGMLQAELDDAVRIHVWHPELRTIPTTNLRCVHDHRFNLESAIVAGCIIDTPYIVLIGEQPFLSTRNASPEFFKTEAFAIRHAKVQGHFAAPLSGDVTQDRDVFDSVSLGEAWAKEAPSIRRKTGTSYSIARRDWHMTRVEALAVTVVYRYDFDDRPARILGNGKSGIVKNSDKALVKRILSEASDLVRR